MKQVRISYTNTRMPALSNKERLMLEREQDSFQDDQEDCGERERRMLNRVSKNRLIRK